VQIQIIYIQNGQVGHPEGVDLNWCLVLLVALQQQVRMLFYIPI